MNPAAILALTATACSKVISDVCSTLGISYSNKDIGDQGGSETQRLWRSTYLLPELKEVLFFIMVGLNADRGRRLRGR
jgi:hypothetical protein